MDLWKKVKSFPSLSLPGSTSLKCQIYFAITNHNFDQFLKVLEYRCSLKSLFSYEWIEAHPVEELMMQMQSFGLFLYGPVNILELAVIVNFLEAVEHLIRTTNLPACYAVWLAGKLKHNAVLSILLRAAIERKIPHIVPEYFLKTTLSSGQYEIVDELIAMDGFEIFVNTLYTSRIRNRRNPYLTVFPGASRPEVLELLLSRGFSADEICCSVIPSLLDPPLYYALFYQGKDCCRCFLRHGADPNCVIVSCGRRGPMGCLWLSTEYINFCTPGTYNDTNRRTDIDEMIELLLRAGMNVSGQGDWIHRCHEVGMIKSEELQQLLTSLCSNPSSLQIICIRVLRLHLSNLAHGTSILPLVDRLPLPGNLKAVLRLDSPIGT